MVVVEEEEAAVDQGVRYDADWVHAATDTARFLALFRESLPNQIFHALLRARIHHDGNGCKDAAMGGVRMEIADLLHVDAKNRIQSAGNLGRGDVVAQIPQLCPIPTLPRQTAAGIDQASARVLIRIDHDRVNGLVYLVEIFPVGDLPPLFGVVEQLLHERAELGAELALAAVQTSAKLALRPQNVQNRKEEGEVEAVQERIGTTGVSPLLVEFVAQMVLHHFDWHFPQVRQFLWPQVPDILAVEHRRQSGSTSEGGSARGSRSNALLRTLSGNRGGPSPSR